MKRAIFILIALLCVAPSVHAQAITSYELIVSVQGSTSAVKTVTVAAVNMGCVTGRSAPSTATLWYAPLDLVRLQFEPDTTRVCTWNGPAVNTLGLATGTIYTMTVSATNEAGLKGDPSTPTNPFGIAGKPQQMQNATLSKGAGG